MACVVAVTYAVTIRERECYFSSTISVRYYVQSYLQRTDDKDKNKAEKGPMLHHKRKVRRLATGFLSFYGESRKPVYQTAIKRQRTAAEEVNVR